MLAGGLSLGAPVIFSGDDGYDLEGDAVGDLNGSDLGGGDFGGG
jgi:hypothetical protein